MKKIGFISLSLLLLLILIPSCITIQAPPITPVGTPPVIIAFSNNPSAINAGGTSTLLWNVTGATSVSIDQGIGQVDVAGIRVISPATSTVYTISATNSSGTVTRSTVTTVISALPPPEAIPFAVTSVIANTSPSTFTGPGTVTYRWERSDNTTTTDAPETIVFTAAGSKTVTNLWTRGEGTGWQRLHVLTPNDTVSSQIDFVMTCWDQTQ